MNNTQLNAMPAAQPSPDSSTVGQALDAACADGQTGALERIDAQALLLHTLGRPSHDRAWLHAHSDSVLPATSHALFTQLCAERARGYPLAYLLGSKEFWGLSLSVNPDVLVPRPDTETLVEWALELDLPEQAQVLDLGTGSGAIALALKKARPNWQIQASDISATALEVARKNAATLQLDINLQHSHWFSSLQAQLFHLIVSNPPYIAEGDPHLPALRHEPSLALVSGSGGFDALNEICSIAPAFLRPQGYLLVEHGYTQGQSVQRLLKEQGFSAVAQRHDLAGHIRCSGGRWMG